MKSETTCRNLLTATWTAEKFRRFLIFFDYIYINISKVKSLFLCFFCLISSYCFSQQLEEFKNVKNYYNHHRVLLNNEFKKKYENEPNILSKDGIKRDFVFFMKKMDSIENVALIGALLKVKNLEDLSKIQSRNLKIDPNADELVSC